MKLQEGTLLKYGSYRIESVLGQGGFGITYLAEQVGLNRQVAIKEFFMKEYCNRDETTSQVSVPSAGSKDLVNRFKAKFIKEAQTIAELDNRHIIKIFDIFEENDTAYYVMEYISGGDLLERIPVRGMREAEAIQYARQIANTLAYIHGKKILHLDIKPRNILFRETGEVVLIDFGVAKHYDEEGGGQTSSTPVGLSKGYAPMEQYNAGGVSSFTPATDIYALGATLFKMVTGKTPPLSTEVYEDGLPSMPKSLSESLKRAIEDAMSPRRKDRPQTIAEFLELLPEASNLPPKPKNDKTELNIDPKPSDKNSSLGQEKQNSMGDWCYEIPKAWQHLTNMHVAKFFMNAGYNTVKTTSSYVKVDGLRFSVQSLNDKMYLVVRGSNLSIGSKMTGRMISWYAAFFFLVIVGSFGIVATIGGAIDEDPTAILIGLVVLIVCIVIAVVVVKTKLKSVIQNFKNDEQGIAQHRQSLVSVIDSAMKR